jgi:hypothetical protein
MNDVRLSLTTKKLIAAAKADVPSATTKAKVWSGVSSSIGAAAGVSASIMTAGGTSSAKLMTIGALFGGTLTVGLAAALITIGPVPNALPRAPVRSSAMAQAAMGNPSAAMTREFLSMPSRPPSPSAQSTHGSPGGAARSHARPPKPATHEDSLAREALLVDEARSALRRGDPESALRAIRAARSLPSRQLVPEELAVEMQALRARGQSDEANGIDVQLRLQYPDSALVR